MAVRPRCCPCGSPVFSQRETSPEWVFTHANCSRTVEETNPEWVFTHANCTRTVEGYSGSSNTGTWICCPNLLRPHLQLTDSGSGSNPEHSTRMPTHPLRASQFYQRKKKNPARERPSKPPLSVQSSNVNSGKRGRRVHKPGQNSGLLIIHGLKRVTELDLWRLQRVVTTRRIRRNS